MYAVSNEFYLQLFLFTLDQPAGQIRAGAGQLAQSALQVAHFGEEVFSFVTQLQLQYKKYFFNNV